MTGLEMTQPPPDGRRSALLIAMSTFIDGQLIDLPSSTSDLRDLAAVLGDPNIGDYEVTTMLDVGTRDVMGGIEQFFKECRVRDLVLFYLSTHGLLDARGKLYFATSETRTDLIASTALNSEFLLEQMDQCRARRQVVLLDSSFSGAFTRAMR